MTKTGRTPCDSGPFVIGVSSLIRHSSFGFRICAVLALAVLAGCASLNLRSILDPGSQSQRSVYLNLMTPEQQDHFYTLEHDGAADSLLLAYVQEIKVYQQWVEQPREVQAVILHRQVVEGMSPLQVRMAWGPPDEERDDTDPADRAAGHKKDVWEFRPKLLKTGETHYEQSVCFFDGRVLWVRRNP